MKFAHTHCCSRVTPEIVYNGKIPNTDTDIAIFQNTDTEFRTDVKNIDKKNEYRYRRQIPTPTHHYFELSVFRIVALLVCKNRLKTVQAISTQLPK